MVVLVHAKDLGWRADRPKCNSHAASGKHVQGASNACEYVPHVSLHALMLLLWFEVTECDAKTQGGRLWTVGARNFSGVIKGYLENAGMVEGSKERNDQSKTFRIILCASDGFRSTFAAVGKDLGQGRSLRFART